MRFPVLVNWHCALSQANQPKIQKLEETWCVACVQTSPFPQEKSGEETSVNRRR